MYIDHLRRRLIRLINIIYRRLRILTKQYFKVVFFIYFYYCVSLCMAASGGSSVLPTTETIAPPSVNMNVVMLIDSTLH